MKRIKIITDVVELENTVNRADIEILQIDIKACEQSQFAQDYFVAVIYYQEQSAPIPQADDYRTKYASLRSLAVQMVSYCNGLEQENADLKAEVERLSKCDETWKTAVTEMCDQAEQIDNLKAEVERLRGDGWISVKERLPDKNIVVIVHISSGDIDVRVLGICDDDPNGLWYCCKGADEPLRFNEVTHWRPLPEQPRGE